MKRKKKSTKGIIAQLRTHELLKKQQYNSFRKGDIVRKRGTKDLYRIYHKISNGWCTVRIGRGAVQDIRYLIYVRPFKVEAERVMDSWKYPRGIHIFNFLNTYAKVSKKRQTTMRILFG